MTLMTKYAVQKFYSHSQYIIYYYSNCHLILNYHIPRTHSHTPLLLVALPCLPVGLIMNSMYPNHKENVKYRQKPNSVNILKTYMRNH